MTTLTNVNPYSLANRLQRLSPPQLRRSVSGACTVFIRYRRGSLRPDLRRWVAAQKER